VDAGRENPHRVVVVALGPQGGHRDIHNFQIYQGSYYEPPKVSKLTALADVAPASGPAPTADMLAPPPPPPRATTAWTAPGLNGAMADYRHADTDDAASLTEAMVRAGDRATSTIPVYGTSPAGEAGAMTLDDAPTGWIARPDPLLATRGGWALYVSVDDMAPALMPGDRAIIHPRRPPTRGRPHAFVREGDGPRVALVAHLEDWTATEWIVRLWSPTDGGSASRPLSRADWPMALPIVGKFDA
jgi:hypothetical protein